LTRAKNCKQNAPILHAAQAKPGQLHVVVGSTTTYFNKRELFIYRDNYLAKLLTVIKPLIGKVGLF
jgi:hypothetical protein